MKKQSKKNPRLHTDKAVLSGIASRAGGTYDGNSDERTKLIHDALSMAGWRIKEKKEFKLVPGTDYPQGEVYENPSHPEWGFCEVSRGEMLGHFTDVWFKKGT